MSFVDHDFHHLLADELPLRSLGVACGSDLLAGSFCEADAKHSEQVSINGLSLHESFDCSVPFLDDSAELVPCDVHSVEVGVAIKSLDFFDLDLHLSPGLFVAVSVQISQRYFKHTTFQTIGSNFYTKNLDKDAGEAYFDRRSCCKE